jgi:hypothetical protein
MEVRFRTMQIAPSITNLTVTFSAPAFISIWPNVMSNKNRECLNDWRLQQLERERWIFLTALVFWESNCDPSRFEVMLDVMKLQGLVIAACSLWKITHELFISKLYPVTLSNCSCT